MKKRESLANVIIHFDNPLSDGQNNRAAIKISGNEAGQAIENSNDQLEKVYIEVTNACNLECRTCMRNVWNEPIGYMDETTFSQVMLGLMQLPIKPLLFFGGYGEPFSHPKILEMIETASKEGYQVELITNGILLDPSVSTKLIDLCVDRVWVSIDGSTPDRYADIRIGNELPKVIENLTAFQNLRERTPSNRTKLGIAFVAMKRNIRDLSAVIQLGIRLGADQFSISNVLAHTKEMQQEVLYQKSLYNQVSPSPKWIPAKQFPRMDVNPLTLPVIENVSISVNNLGLNIEKRPKGGNICPFINGQSISIRWDGKVSTCLPLLHSHESYLDDIIRKSHAYSVGNINENDLFEIWNDREYSSLRDRLRIFDFSPCTVCNSCEMAEANLEDCFGNVHPACGGCLWAQGFIQCP